MIYAELSPRTREAVRRIIRDGIAEGYGARLADTISKASDIPMQHEHARDDGSWTYPLHESGREALRRWAIEGGMRA